ncbi:hypothetical protein AB0F71_18365 [Kitasatospora sp. NPDC028055]|uniref:hypothetical protein n=1 Tax=Kitasatospora sp. NPDC028055 TaxID=3155653 RepID=UPI0034069931
MFGFRKLAATGAAAVALAGLGSAGTAVAAPAVSGSASSLQSCDLYAGQPYRNSDGRVWVNGGGNNCGGAYDRICVWLQLNSWNNVYTMDIQCSDVVSDDRTWPATSNYGPGMWGGKAIAYKNGAIVATAQSGAWL